MQAGAHEQVDSGPLQPLSVPSGVTTLPLAILLPIMDAIEARERYPRSRVRNVAMYAVALARVLDLSPTMIATIRLGALLCNLGMLRVPEAILGKETVLTPDEQRQIPPPPHLRGRSPWGGRRMCARSHRSSSTIMRTGAATAIRSGSAAIGSPSARGSSASARPTTRSPASGPTAPPTPPAEALKALHAGSGRQFDPRIAYEFRQMMRREPERDAVLDPGDVLQTSELAWRVVAATTGLGH